MEFIVVSLAALMASTLTLFSGFGLGTLLMPVVAIFFPVEVAVAITAMVHLANNLFKVVLLGRAANKTVLLNFGIPAMLAALAGALALGWLAKLPSVLEYVALDRHMQISPINLTVGLLILVFVILEFSSGLSDLALDRKYLPYGGLISGFFGGLSGNQGAFRSMFLLKTGLGKEEFVATGVMLAIMVDLSRMLIYGWGMSSQQQIINWPLVITATLSAFAGAYLGKKLLKKLTIRSIQVVVATLLVLISLGLISGVL
jgi:uncharacterized protein